MIKIDTSIDVRGAIRQLADVKDRQLPFATSLAINKTAQKVKAREEHEIRDVFDRPTPYIQNSIFIKPSNKRNLTATVGIKDQAVKGTPATKILRAEIRGGERRLKAFERLLRSRGIIPSGFFLIPGEKAPMDQYGNVQRGFIKQLLSYFEAFPEAGYKMNSTQAKRDKLKQGSKKRDGLSYYVAKVGKNKQFGIWKRTHISSKFNGPRQTNKTEPMFILAETSRYEAIFDFEFVALSTVDKEFRQEFLRAWEQAKGTAR